MTESAQAIDWQDFDSDEDFTKLLELIIRQLPIASMNASSKQGIVDAVADCFKKRECPYEITVNVSEPDAVGIRVIQCSVVSPITGRTLSFSY